MQRSRLPMQATRPYELPEPFADHVFEHELLDLEARELCGSSLMYFLIRLRLHLNAKPMAKKKLTYFNQLLKVPDPRASGWLAQFTGKRPKADDFQPQTRPKVQSLRSQIDEDVKPTCIHTHTHTHTHTNTYTHILSGVHSLVSFRYPEALFIHSCQ